jgi:hypothetical protein
VAAPSLVPLAMAQLLRRRELSPAARWNVSLVVKDWGGETANSIGFCRNDARAEEQLAHVEWPVATSVNLKPSASAVKATAGNKKHNDDDEKKGSGVHGSLLAKSN